MRRRDFLRTSSVAVGVSLLEGCRSTEEQFIVQVPRRPGVLQGESVWRAGVCNQCSAGCAIQVRVVDGNAKKVEGSPDYPVNHGGVCALGQSLLQEVYNPDRFLAPQRLAGARGEGVFEPVSWEDALAQVVDALGGRSGQNLAFVGGDRWGFTGALLRRLAATLGAPSPTFIEAPGLDVERVAARIALGVDDVPYFDIGRSDYVLSIGAPMLDRWRSPVHYIGRLTEMRSGRPGRRGKLVQAEARMSLTAAKADEWLPVRPGTEGMLARGIAGLLLAEGGPSAEAREQYGRLFPDDPPGLDEVAETCDVAAEHIERVASELSEAEARVVVAGGSAAAHTNGVYNVAAGLGLNLLLDNLGQPGGVFAPSRLDLAGGVVPDDGGPTEPGALAARLRGESGDPVEVLFVAEADPLHALPASWGMADALDGVETIVSLSSFTDDTTLHADLVLPLLTEIERFTAVEPSASVGVGVLGLAEPAVDPLGEANHPAEVILAVAAALGEPVAGQFPWSSLEALVRERIEQDLATLPGGAETDASSYYFDALDRGGIIEDGPPSVAPAGPSASAPAAAAASFEGDAGEFPFQLLPYESAKVASGRGANRPWLQELPDPMSTVMWNTWIEISPYDAESLGLTDGDRLRVESPSGSVEAPVVIDPTVRPGVVGMPMGLGHQDYGRYASGRGANPMHLVGSLEVDGASAPAWAATRVRIERIGTDPVARFGRSYTERLDSEGIPVALAPNDTGAEELA